MLFFAFQNFDLIISERFEIPMAAPCVVGMKVGGVGAVGGIACLAGTVAARQATLCG